MKLLPTPSILCGVLALGLGQPADAAVNLVQNGGFEQTTVILGSPPANNHGGGQLAFNVNATGWTSTGSQGAIAFNLIFPSGSADTTGLTTMLPDPVLLWGPHSGSANGLPASSPAGGNFLAADAADDVGTISQTISGLTPHEIYNVSFYWGGVAQTGYTTATTEQWQVSLGAETLSTPLANVASMGFSGWMSQSLNFTASGSSEVLSFLAAGGPGGQPPFALLDGVTMVDTGTHAAPVPEPSTLFSGAATVLLLVGARASRTFAKRTQL